MKKAQTSHTGQKAQFLNMREDGIKIRAAKFKNLRAYDRKRSGSKSGQNEF